MALTVVHLDELDKPQAKEALEIIERLDEIDEEISKADKEKKETERELDILVKEIASDNNPGYKRDRKRLEAPREGSNNSKEPSFSPGHPIIDFPEPEYETSLSDDGGSVVIYPRNDNCREVVPHEASRDVHVIRLEGKERNDVKFLLENANKLKEKISKLSIEKRNSGVKLKDLLYSIARQYNVNLRKRHEENRGDGHNYRIHLSSDRKSFVVLVD